MKFFKPSKADYSIGLAIGMTAAILVTYLIAACSSPPPPMSEHDIKHVKTHKQTIDYCMAVGRDAGTYAAYDNCKAEAGIVDGVSP